MESVRETDRQTQRQTDRHRTTQRERERERERESLKLFDGRNVSLHVHVEDKRNVSSDR